MSSRPVPLLALVVPCYNEEETLPRTLDALAELLARCKAEGLIRPESYALYVDDGSRDKTWEILAARHALDPFCRGVSFAANAGHQNAVWAGMGDSPPLGRGLHHQSGRRFEDDITPSPAMWRATPKARTLSTACAMTRSTDTAFKRGTAHFFYRLMGWLNVRLIPDHADYRLASRPVLEALQGFEEQTLFLRGLFPTLGFKTEKVYYSRLSRQAGESKYPLLKMLSFAWRGITSCSAAPLRLAGFMSLACMLTALIYSLISLYKYLLGETIQGWTSLIIVVLLLGAVQLFCLALIGEYIAKIFTEVRRRPRYIVEKIL